MSNISPTHYASIQDLLTALNFISDGEVFVKGEVRFPVGAIIGHTPVSFYEHMKKSKWLEEDKEEESVFYTWGNLWIVYSD